MFLFTDVSQEPKRMPSLKQTNKQTRMPSSSKLKFVEWYDLLAIN